MPLRLMVYAENSPTFPAPGSWRKGDIVEPREVGSPLGNLERPPMVVICDLLFRNTPEPTWIQAQIDAEGGRRTIGLTEAEVDSIIAADPINGIRTYGSAGQFISRLETKKAGAAATFVGEPLSIRELADMMHRAHELEEAGKTRALTRDEHGELRAMRRWLDAHADVIRQIQRRDQEEFDAKRGKE